MKSALCYLREYDLIKSKKLRFLPFHLDFYFQHKNDMKATGPYQSVKWISSSSDGFLRVNNCAKDVFAQIADKKCNMISIFGLARQGKSFLMNCLANEDSIFTVSDKMDPVMLRFTFKNN